MLHLMPERCLRKQTLRFEKSSRCLPSNPQTPSLIHENSSYDHSCSIESKKSLSIRLIHLMRLETSDSPLASVAVSPSDSLGKVVKMVLCDEQYAEDAITNPIVGKEGIQHTMDIACMKRAVNYCIQAYQLHFSLSRVNLTLARLMANSCVGEGKPGNWVFLNLSVNEASVFCAGKTRGCILLYATEYIHVTEDG
ncbi:hypothetical protein BDB01DRAFT_836826 [Pilobolus umbonatus]|nr:hypothetical protein BDB01DRAFT_836826 [Pilobolus umbonatus]